MAYGFPSSDIGLGRFGPGVPRITWDISPTLCPRSQNLQEWIHGLMTTKFDLAKSEPEILKKLVALAKKARTAPRVGLVLDTSRRIWAGEEVMFGGI